MEKGCTCRFTECFTAVRLRQVEKQHPYCVQIFKSQGL